MALKTYTVTVRIRGERPGIGAVVAMVAAARMVLGEWQPEARTRIAVSHWDFVPSEMAQTFHAACGNVWPGDYGAAAGISDVDCLECLAIARQAGLLTDAS